MHAKSPHLKQQRPMLLVANGVHQRTGGVGTMTEPLKAPFVYFGGKSAIAPLVWQRLGDCDNVIEPFCGSAAFLLARPHPPKAETLNDADCMVANFWRATSRDPEAVAEYADGPVNEADLHARHRYLVLSDDARAFRQRMKTEPDYHDVKFAGWWCWGLCCWIGGGWCAYSNGPGRRPGLSGDGEGVHALSQQIPCMDAGRGVNASPGSVEGDLSQQRPDLGSGRGPGMLGVHGVTKLPQGRPQLADAYDIGRGVHAGAPSDKRLPMLSGHGNGGSAGYGIHTTATDYKPPPGSDIVHGGGMGHGEGTCAARRAWLVDWFERLRDRLRLVRVCCGDFERVCGSPSVLTRLGTTGVFMDAPYKTKLKCGKKNRSEKLYATDGTGTDDVVDRVIAWCLKWGNDPLIRVVAACYEGEGYEILRGHGWTVEEWVSSGGYGNRNKANKNRNRERLFVSPHCLKKPQRSLFDGLAPEAPS